MDQEPGAFNWTKALIGCAILVIGWKIAFPKWNILSEYSDSISSNSTDTCPVCGGTGYIQKAAATPKGPMGGTLKCKRCKGTGKI